jgi:hypothetical protein
LQTPKLDCALFLLQFHVTKKLLCQLDHVLLLANRMEAMSDTAIEEVWKSISTTIEMEMAEVSVPTGWHGARRTNEGSEGSKGSMKQAGSPGGAALPDPGIPTSIVRQFRASGSTGTPNTFRGMMRFVPGFDGPLLSRGLSEGF